MARKILLADDSVTAQNMGRKILADAGYDIITVNNGSAALKRITETKPDLIVLDVYMPGYSGLEVCQRIKGSAETAHIPVLLTVGKLEPFKPEEARRAKADGHIVKPFEASELLSAITKLEDRMVPQQAEPGRFGAASGGRKAESSDEGDSGWKSRLRFPSKKKREEADPAPPVEEAAPASFRDFRKSRGKSAADEIAPARAAAAPEPELVPDIVAPDIVPDIPRDITPEELDALSALAAKLDGPPVAEEALAAEKTFAVEAPATQTIGPEAAETDLAPAEEIAAAMATAMAIKTEAEVPAAPAADVPVEQVAVAATTAAAATHFQAEAAMVTVSASAAHVAQEPAPIDKSDEPMFARGASAVEALAAAKAGGAEEIEAKTEAKTTEEKPETKAFQVVGQHAKLEAPGTSARVEAVAAESKPEESEPEEPKREEWQAEAAPPQASHGELPSAARLPRPAEIEESTTPTEAELTEALRLLTPATGGSDVSTPAHDAAARPRWMAEAVAPTPEEAARSLEAEMFGSFAATASAPESSDKSSAKAATQPVVEAELSPTGRLSSITAVVDSRLAEAELAATSNLAATPAPQGAAEELAAGPRDFTVLAEESPAEEIAATTFADAVGQPDAEPALEAVLEPVLEPDLERVCDPQPEPLSHTADAVAPDAAAAGLVTAEEIQDSTADAEGEAMGKESPKDVKAKSGKWHQIRTGPAGAVSNGDALEAAKQADPPAPAEEAAKAMAAAADGSAASPSASDAGTIASIVDSVMADLRPRIVEEIARKLAGK